jgi:hypothetical protein
MLAAAPFIRRLPQSLSDLIGELLHRCSFVGDVVDVFIQKSTILSRDLPPIPQNGIIYPDPSEYMMPHCTLGLHT